MTKNEFILRAASNAPSVPDYYKPEFAAFVPPVKNAGEKDMIYRGRLMRARGQYNVLYSQFRSEKWPIAYAEKLASDMETENQVIFDAE